MKYKLISYVLISLTLFANYIHAIEKDFIDFGIRGHLYDIKEKSFKEDIASRLKDIDYSFWEKDLLDNAKKSLIIASNKPNCIENKSYILDPTFEISEDIFIPYMNKVLYKKGYLYNPLKENQIKFNTHQIFIDADDIHQLMLAVKYSKKADIFIVKGNVKNILDYDILGYVFRENVEGKSFKVNCLPTVYTQKDFTFIVNEYLLNDSIQSKESSND